MPFSEGNLEKIKQTHLGLLMRLAQADDRTHPLEDRLIMDVARQMGMDYDEVQAIREKGPDVTLELPELEEERLVIFYHLLFLMRIDGVVTEEEMELCRQIGFRLGLNPNMTDELIRLMAKYVNEKLPPDLLKQTVKKYLN